MTELPRIGQTVGDKYCIEALLGRGGMGAVYRARHQFIDKVVALKWLHPASDRGATSRKRFLREAQLAARVQHPHVVEIYDFGVDNETPYLVMELLQGETLSTVLEQGSAPTADVLRWLVEGMRGVASAHRLGVVHRDIKPENMFVVRGEHQPRGAMKILDFGISKLVGEAVPRLTITGAALGTPMYMSLEQLSGKDDVDARTDIYSFGVLLFQLFTGRLPFESDSLAGLAFAIATLTPPTPRSLCPALPSELDRIIWKAMAREREARFQSLSELITALTPYCERPELLGAQGRVSVAQQPGTTGSIAPVSVASVIADSRDLAGAKRRKPMLWGVAAVLGLGVLGSWLSRTPQTTSAPSSAQTAPKHDVSTAQPAAADVPPPASAIAAPPVPTTAVGSAASQPAAAEPLPETAVGSAASQPVPEVVAQPPSAEAAVPPSPQTPVAMPASVRPSAPPAAPKPAALAKPAATRRPAASPVSSPDIEDRPGQTVRRNDAPASTSESPSPASMSSAARTDSTPEAARAPDPKIAAPTAPNPRAATGQRSGTLRRDDL